MRYVILTLAATLLVITSLLPGICAPQSAGNTVPPPPPEMSEAQDQEATEEPAPTSKADEPPKTELDLLQDPTIKVEVDPLVVSNLVDRVVEPATIIVRCPDPMSAEVYLVPVDAPYGGKALANPRLIGKGVHSADGFKIRWDNKEPDQYVKIFAVVRRRSSPDRRVRSHTIDLAIGGTRFEPASSTARP